MSFFLRGALVEYGRDVLGSIPNIVVFQFNPENISRTINIPSDTPRSSSDSGKTTESHTMSGAPTESFSITVHFSAADDLGEGGAGAVIPRLFGIGPQLAALEKMVHPTAGLLSVVVGAAVDAIGSALSLGSSPPSEPRPREDAPRILFIWGPARLLPVKIKSISMTEQKFDPLLNPVQAQVEIGMEIIKAADIKDDPIGSGALIYTNTVKEAQALLNLAKAVELTVDVIPF